MEIDNSLIKDILQQLEKVYPSSIESSDNILPKYENRNELLNHLSLLQILAYRHLSFCSFLN